MLGALGALAVLAFVFASFLAFLPLVVAAVSILTTFILLLPLTYLTDVSFIVEFLVALIGLGVAIDYSLILVNRWREERAHGRDNHDAVVTAMETAGKAVVFSGVTVAIGLLALVVLPVPFMRSIGMGGALIPLASVFTTLTLTPAILGGIGPRVDWPKIRHENRASRAWSSWARVVVRRKFLAAGAAVLATGPGSSVNGHQIVVVIPEKETVNNKTVAPVRGVKDAVDKLPGVIGVAGVGADQIDFLKAVYGNFPLMLGIIAVLTIILLARAFRSVLLPIKAVLLNLISLAATLGFMVWFWQSGHGSDAIFGVAQTGAVTFWIPLMVFAFLFGLSMDYEVFILARIREEYDRGKSTDAAVITGIGRTGRLITSAALILFLAFVALASGPGTHLKTFATALGFGILLA